MMICAPLLCSPNTSVMTMLTPHSTHLWSSLASLHLSGIMPKFSLYAVIQLYELSAKAFCAILINGPIKEINCLTSPVKSTQCAKWPSQGKGGYQETLLPIPRHSSLATIMQKARFWSGLVKRPPVCLFHNSVTSIISLLSEIGKHRISPVLNSVSWSQPPCLGLLSIGRISPPNTLQPVPCYSFLQGVENTAPPE